MARISSTPTSPSFPITPPVTPNTVMRTQCQPDYPVSISPLNTSFQIHAAHRRSLENAYSMGQDDASGHGESWSSFGPSGMVQRRNSSVSSTGSPWAEKSADCGLPLFSERSGSIAHVSVHDGRQSRMAMRSPIIDRVFTLPLRVNTSVANNACSEAPAPTTERHDMPPHEAGDMMDLEPAMEWSSPPSPRPFRRSAAPSPEAACSAPTPLPKLRIKVPPPPRYHVTVRPTLSPRTAQNRAQYGHSVAHLGAQLVPLISVTNGLPHPEFPTSLLQYHLLTHDQLDRLVRWYHQVEPAVEETFMYPTWIPSWTSLHGRKREGGDLPDLETKRRRWGRFIGLKGCETPNTTGPPGESGEELIQRMEREWRRAIEKAEDEERLMEKGWRGRW